MITHEEPKMKRSKQGRTGKAKAAAKPARAPKARPARPARAARSKPLTDAEMVNLARQAVPERLRSSRVSVRRSEGGRIARAGAGPADDAAAQLARLVGAKLPTDLEDDVVEFQEETQLGMRHTAVHIRKGGVTRVVTRAKR